MSMNIFITGSRKITFKKKNGKRGGGIQTVKFNAVQTSTDVTYKIVGSGCPKQAYIDYIKSQSDPQKEPIYADDDIWGERDPVGFEMFDWTVEHLQEFENWIREVEEEGYTVKFEVI